MGRERALTAHPLTEVPTVQAAVDTTRQARVVLASAGAPPLEDVPDIRPVLDRARAAGSLLEGAELILLLPVVDAGTRLAGYGRAVRADAPDVARITDDLPALGDLGATLREALEDDGSVKDPASPALARLRREARERRRRIVAELERTLQGAEADRVFSDRYVTIRHGRYVLPVRAESRGRVRGIVHDRSQSGQTLFVEPADVVEANNDLVQVLREEEAETARVLAELTDRVRARLADLDHLVDTLGAVDWIFARAHAAERMGASAPVIDGERRVALRSARHPLLIAQSWGDPARAVVPMDIELGADRPLLVITGPNAGGKTIALKTLALSVLMAQTGCHVPAAEGSRLPVFAGLHAIVGDDQSVAENLSTFSAFVKQVREVLAEADEGSLVLLDELGAGTDPDEGAALARAILEELDARGALVVATTHLEPLKTFASTYPRARNASVEFDTASLTPTFRLRYDHPGQSYALTIAGRLGLAPDLIARAQSHRSADQARLGQLIARLDEASRSEADRTLTLERRESETAARLAAARRAEAEAGEKARQLVNRAKAEAATLLTDIRRAIASEWERLKRSERSTRSLDESRRRLREAAARADQRLADEPAAPSAPREALTAGARVTAPHLGLHGELVEIAGTTAVVRSGALTIRVPLSALRPAEATPRDGRAVGENGRADGRPGDLPKSVASNRRATPGTASDAWGRSQSDFGRSPGRPSARAADRDISAEILLLGRTTDEARDIVEKYLDDAFMAGLPSVRLIHGKGSGALRKAVRALLTGHPLVDSFRDGEPSEGGSGATVAALRVS